MEANLDPIAADRQFFDALVQGSLENLEQLLDDDFILIDVMSGSEITKAALLSAVGSGQLKFEAIKPLEARHRRYGTAAVITGSTRIDGRFEGSPFQAHSRYTHVYVLQHGRWRLVSAQGTQIAGEPAASP